MLDKDQGQRRLDTTTLLRCAMLSSELEDHAVAKAIATARSSHSGPGDEQLEKMHGKYMERLDKIVNFADDVESTLLRDVKDYIVRACQHNDSHFL